VGRAGTTRKRPGASIADIRAVRGGLGYGGSDGSETPAGHLAVVDGTLAASTQEGINRFTPPGECEIDLARRELRVQRSRVPIAGRARCGLCVRQNLHAQLRANRCRLVALSKQIDSAVDRRLAEVQLTHLSNCRTSALDPEEKFSRR